jgi:hypothetical protein
MAEQHDATVLLQLAQWGSMMGLEEAEHVIMSPDFDADAADPRDKLVSRMLNFGETVGTLTKNGLVDRALIKDWLWVEGIWARVSPAVEKIRSEFGEPRLYENFEALAAE